jgi:spiro-SPASM protein
MTAGGLRANGQNPVNWILSLDAAGSACYGVAHGVPTDKGDSMLREAVSVTGQLMELFPGAVWPQMVRMNENEIELEPFYRFWKEKAGRVIVQKHDGFCGTIENRRVADLSPLVRHECWHIKRDMCILIDGTVPMCREDLYANNTAGNAISGEFAVIWQKAGAVHEQHVKCIYEGMCGACDEYYTFNF